MKKNKFKYIKALCLGSLLFIISGCTDLDEKWYSEATPDKYFTSKQSVLTVLYRPFTHFRWFVENDRWRLQELTADGFAITTKGPHWYNGGIYQRFIHHAWTPNDGEIWETWRGGTMGIALAMETKEDLNTFVDYEALGFTQAEKDAHQMQLQTLIAYLYMRTLDYFGGMPIFTSTTQENVPRSTDKETFAHIETLLKEAIPQLEKKTEIGKPEDGSIKQAAAVMMLAQLYFNAEAYIGESRFAECAKLSQELIDGVYGAYDLDPTWHGPHGFDNDKSPEMIWCTPSQNAKLTFNWFWSAFYHYESYKYFDIEGGADNGTHLQPSRKPTGEIYTEYKLGKPYEKFNDKDLRKQPYLYLGNKQYKGMFLVGTQTNPVTGVSSRGTQEYKDQIITFVDQVAQFRKVGTDYPNVASLPSNIASGEENTGIRLVKVPQPNLAEKTIRWNPDNPLARLAEVYYMLAECKMRAGDKAGAATLINKVRARNFENRIDPDPVTSANLDEYRILDEWMVEFLGEGRRRTDLIRWNKFLTEKWWDHEASNDKNLNRFPVPARALSGSNLLEQNPGY
ncbi:RagB/SusD family nutrient uptake outer membrane protein [Dysgonomonas sp. ZJ279]|uniref:RagB/SusD family nutrient uptake outer membrane protein n=1 Tax=Dysgonomonas sp. ZJ279 TaxID=2709796 RepID=UPI0013ED376E|nr:RagB/SusD family nutrient uptake outer membrane protein [Dysgonomonas sp. ZJ279]